MEEQTTLRRGDKVHRPYRSDFIVNDLGSDGSYSRQDITDTDENLTIDQEKEVSFYIREIDEMQSNFRTANLYADDAAVKLGNQIDGQVFGEYSNATSDVDDGDLGATDNDGIELTTSNIDKVFGEANEALDALDIDMDDRWAVISPQFYNILWQRIGGRASLLGDASGQRGHSGFWAGFRLIRSNALAWSAVLALATNPTDQDTLVFTLGSKTATILFEATLDAAVEGSCHIGSTVDDTRANLAAALNAPTTDIANSATAGFTGFTSGSDGHIVLSNITATNDNSADTLTIVKTGASFVAVSETLTDGTDTWTANSQIQHNLFGQGKPIDLVIQKRPNTVIKDRSGFLGKDVVSWTVFGKKTFNEGADQLVDIKIKSANF